MDQDWLAQAVVRATAEAIVVADPDGTIILWNGGAERVFGYPAEQALGRSLDLIVPEKQRARHWAGYEKVMATGVTKYGAALLKVPAVHRDGHRLSIEFSVALLHGPDDKIVGITAVIRDVTERWNAERALRARLAATEEKIQQQTGLSGRIAARDELLPVELGGPFAVRAHQPLGPVGVPGRDGLDHAVVLVPG
jgi:PAS domain S-box-containing protein